MISITGGVYTERCVEPHWDDVYGSGGRAAAAISNEIDGIKLHTYRANDIEDGLENLESAYGINISGPAVPESVTFDYMHGLATPRITPRPDAIKNNPVLEISDDVVLRFGMLEGTAKINAERAIYDPQSAFDPRPFAENGLGSKAENLAMVLNRLEVSKFADISDPYEAVNSIIANGVAEVVVLKMGGQGALVTSGSSRHLVPAYKSETVWKIGSGDVVFCCLCVLLGRRKTRS